MNRYRHTQIGFAVIVPVAVGVVVFLVFFASGKLPVPVWSAAVVVLMAALMLGLFGSLTVSIDEERLVAAFGIGLVRKTISLTRISSYEPIRMRWVHGFGIHWIPFHGWLYNVSGLKAVKITGTNGRRTYIGTDEPEALCKALEGAVHPNAGRISR